jgi:hypothetical protein
MKPAFQESWKDGVRGGGESGGNQTPAGEALPACASMTTSVDVGRKADGGTIPAGPMLVLMAVGRRGIPAAARVSFRQA